MKTILVVLFLVLSAAYVNGQELRAMNRKPFLLSDDELAVMKEQVRRQCKLPRKTRGHILGITTMSWAWRSAKK